MAYVKIPKPNQSTYSVTNLPAGKQQYDESDITYDQANVFYDSVNVNQYTKINKPNVSSYTKIPKPV